MLVLSRKVGERIQIGNDIQIVVTKASSGRVTIGIDAPAAISIRRPEAYPTPSNSNFASHVEAIGETILVL